MIYRWNGRKLDWKWVHGLGCSDLPKRRRSDSSRKVELRTVQLSSVPFRGLGIHLHRRRNLEQHYWCRCPGKPSILLKTRLRDPTFLTIIEASLALLRSVHKHPPNQHQTVSPIRARSSSPNQHLRQRRSSCERLSIATSTIHRGRGYSHSRYCGHCSRCCPQL